MSAIGIRREDKGAWERRVPLVPRDIRWLLKTQGVQTVVEPSETRAFSEEEFEAAGADIGSQLSECAVILGIKEIPVEALLPDQAYAFFAHVIKGQPANMPMLQRLLDLECTLIDYERIADEHQRRLIFFGRQAGWAGMVDTLWAFGQRLKAEGVSTPLQAIRPMPAYGGMPQARAALAVVNEWITAEGLPRRVAPVIIGVAGYGNVSTGAQEILDLLPVIEITPHDVARLARDQTASRHHLYKVVFKEADMVEPKAPNATFDLQEYYEEPEWYRGVFSEYLPHLSVLVNAIYWAPQYPRLVTKADLKELYGREQAPQLKVIGDISCDIEGAIEATVRATDPGDPVYVYEPATERTIPGCEGQGPVIMAVDILPSELPRESSATFSHALRAFVPDMAHADYSVPFEALELPDPIKRAVIVHRGLLTPDYRYLERHLDR